MVISSKLINISEEQHKERVLRNLQILCEKTGYQIIQTNGQRVYSPPASMKIAEPPRGSEIFIGRLKRSIYEDDLIPLFERVGRLYKFRLMLDFTEKTRGYAFATYFCPEDADEAVRTFHNYEIKPNVRIGVYKSVDNCRLFIGNVPTEKTKEDVFDMLTDYVTGITEVIMYMDPQNRQLNRGFVFVEFANHRLAAMARRQFSPENLTAWGRALYVDWADPLPEVDPNVMSKVTILFLKNIPVEYSSDELHTIICNCLASRTVRKTHKMTDYAFIHFINRKAAESALKRLTETRMSTFLGLKINNVTISVEWAIPRTFSKKNRLASAPLNFCTSVPPNMRRLVHQRNSQRSLENSVDYSNTGLRSSCSVSPPENKFLNNSNYSRFGTDASSFISSSPSDDSRLENKFIPKQTSNLFFIDDFMHSGDFPLQYPLNCNDNKFDLNSW